MIAFAQLSDVHVVDAQSRCAWSSATGSTTSRCRRRCSARPTGPTRCCRARSPTPWCARSTTSGPDPSPAGPSTWRSRPVTTPTTPSSTRSAGTSSCSTAARSGSTPAAGPSTKAWPTARGLLRPGLLPPARHPSRQGRGRLPQALRLPRGAGPARRGPRVRSSPRAWTCRGTPCFGNHDGLVQGNFPQNLQLSLLSTGALKIMSTPAGLSPAELINSLMSGDILGIVQSLALTPAVRLVTPDTDRRLLTRKQVVEQHFVNGDPSATASPENRSRARRTTPSTAATTSGSSCSTRSTPTATRTARSTRSSSRGSRPAELVGAGKAGRGLQPPHLRGR